MEEKNTTSSGVVSARVGGDVKAELEKMAKQDRRPVGQLVAIILEDYIAKKQKAASAAA